MNYLLDLVTVLVFLLVQSRVTALLLRRCGGLPPGWPRRAARAGVWLFNALLLAGYLLSVSSLVNRLGIRGSWALIVGAGALAYLMASTAVLALHTALAPVRRLVAEPSDPGRRLVLKAAGAAVVASPVAMMGYGVFVQRTDFRVVEVEVPLAGLPDDLAGLRILQLSDIHLSAFLSEQELARVIDAANELRPHLALITGDLITSLGDPLEACIRQLARVRSDAGMYGCMGNHERFAFAERRAAEAGARVGIRFLRAEAARLRFGAAVLNLAGVDYQSLYNKQNYLKEAKALVVPGAANVLLSHNPDVFPVAARQGYNLLFAGHTHGGQVAVEILDRSVNPARFFTPYVYGLYRSSPSAAAYVTRGIGTIGIPARIGAPPEIAVVRLRKA